MATIKSIEKKGKDNMYVKNWRPISLLNVDVKKASKALAKGWFSVATESESES